MIFDDTFNHEVWNDTDETRVVLFVDVMRPLPFPESAINEGIVKAIGYSPVRARRQAQPGGLGSALPQSARRRGRARGQLRRPEPARLRVERQPGAFRVLASLLRIVNSPVRISRPSTIITSPPIAMITGKWRLTTVSAIVIRSKASGDQQERDRQARRVEGQQQRAVGRRARDRGLGEDRAQRDARAGRPGDREGRAGDAAGRRGRPGAAASRSATRG